MAFPTASAVGLDLSPYFLPLDFVHINEGTLTL